MNFGGAIRVNKLGVLIVIGIGCLLLLFTYNSHKTTSQNSVPINSARLVNIHNTNDNSVISSSVHQVSLKQILIAAVDVAIRGGDEVVAVREQSVNLDEKIKGKTKEGAKDKVTEGDFRSHRVMYYGLRKAFPHVKVISEEHDEKFTEMKEIAVPSLVNPEISSIFQGDEAIDADDISVWVDPLDATQEYTENLLDYVTTMVCVAVKGVPVIGVIHKPFPPVETYWAIVGYGHSRNFDKYLHTNADKSAGDKASQNTNQKIEGESAMDSKKKPIRIIVSRSHAGSVRNLTEQLLGPKANYEITAAAGAGYKVMEVIKGKADAYLHVTNIKKWDLCASNAILNAIEGTMITLNGEKLDYSPDTNPVNTKGILAFMKASELSDKFKDIPLDID